MGPFIKYQTIIDRNKSRRGYSQIVAKTVSGPYLSTPGGIRVPSKVKMPKPVAKSAANPSKPSRGRISAVRTSWKASVCVFESADRA